MNKNTKNQPKPIANAAVAPSTPAIFPPLPISDPRRELEHEAWRRTRDEAAKLEQLMAERGVTTPDAAKKSRS